MYATDYLETKILNLLRGISATAPGTVYLGLYLNSPGEAGGGTEVSYAGYARKPVVLSAPAAMSGGIGVQNVEEITYATTPSAVGSVTHLGLLDSLTGGNMLCYAELTEPLVLGAGEAPVLVAGEVQWWLTGHLCNTYKTKILNLLRGINCAGFTPYLSLYNGDPESSGAELAGGGYARVAMTFGAPAEQSTGQMMVQNTVRALTARATTAWGNWSHTVLFDAEANGQPVWSIPRMTPKEIRKGLMVVVEAGEFSVVVN